MKQACSPCETWRKNLWQCEEKKRAKVTKERLLLAEKLTKEKKLIKGTKKQRNANLTKEKRDVHEEKVLA